MHTPELESSVSEKDSMLEGQNIYTDSFGNTISPETEVIEDDEISHDEPTAVMVCKNINELPAEILIRAFQYLDPESLGDASEVCTMWRSLVQEKQTWVRSFTNQFNTRETFPSLSNSRWGIEEYRSRLRVKKRWAKGTALHQNYSTYNPDHIWFVQVNFERNNLIAYFNFNGDVTMCQLNGKNQVHIPGNNCDVGMNSCFCVNEKYIAMGKWNGDIWIKNMYNARITGSNLQSTVRWQSPRLEDRNRHLQSIPVPTCIDLNSNISNYGSNFDCISGDVYGVVLCWTIRGELIKSIIVSDYPIFKVQSNYDTHIIATDTQGVIHTIDAQTFKLKGSVSTGLTIDIHDINFSEWKDLMFVDVDYGDNKVILTCGYKVTVVDYINHKIKKSWTSDIPILYAKLQTVQLKKLFTRDKSLAGLDGLLYAHVLENQTVVIWNVRDDQPGDRIQVQCYIKPVKAHRHMTISSISLNSSIAVLGHYNGISGMYDVFTGDYIKDCSVRLPKDRRHDDDIFVQRIELNPDPMITNGIAVVGSKIQYFQFGDIPTRHGNKKKLGTLNGGKKLKITNKTIRDELVEYDIQEEARQENERLVTRFNGDSISDDDDVSLALAMSRSEQSTPSTHTTRENEEEEELRLAMALSMTEQETFPSELPISDPDEDDYESQLAEALRLSISDA